MSSEASLLLVDDDENNRDILSRRLASQGYKVTSVEDGYTALERLWLESFDLILLDIMMPDINGIEVLKKIKANPEIESIPVIMLSAENDRDTVIECLKIGAKDYLVKPYNMPLINKRISNLLQIEFDKNKEKLKYLPDIRVLVVDDNDVNCDLLSSCLRRLGFIQIDTAGNGKLALASLKEKEYDLILLDIMMPVMDGYTALEEIKSNRNTKDIPVIMISADNEKSSIDRCIELGAIDYVVKPYSTALIKARVESCLEHLLFPSDIKTSSA